MGVRDAPSPCDASRSTADGSNFSDRIGPLAHDLAERIQLAQEEMIRAVDGADGGARHRPREAFEGIARTVLSLVPATINSDPENRPRSPRSARAGMARAGAMSATPASGRRIATRAATAAPKE